jgi:hypothetical protein
MKFIPTLSLLFFAIPNAQAIVNIEDKERTNQQQGLSGSLSLNGNGSIGNSETSLISLKSHINYLHGKHTEILLLNATYDAILVRLATSQHGKYLRNGQKTPLLA